MARDVRVNLEGDASSLIRATAEASASLGAMSAAADASRFKLSSWSRVMNESQRNLDGFGRAQNAASRALGDSARTLQSVGRELDKMDTSVEGTTGRWHVLHDVLAGMGSVFGTAAAGVALLGRSLVRATGFAGSLVAALARVALRSVKPLALGGLGTAALGLGAVGLAATPFGLAAAAVAGAGLYFDRNTKAGKDLMRTLGEILHTFEKLAGPIMMPVLRVFDQLAHRFLAFEKTKSFKADLQALGQVIQQVTAITIRFAEYIYQNWPGIERVLKDILNAGVAVARAFMTYAWPLLKRFGEFTARMIGQLAGWFKAHWGQIKAVVSAVAGYFVANIWPRMVAVFDGIKKVVANLAHGFMTAWPQISSAASTVWGSVLKPLLHALWTVLSAIGSAILWLSRHSGPAFAALATAVKAIAGVVGTILSGIASAISAVISGLQWIGNHLGWLSSGGGLAQSQRTGIPHGKATGGPVAAGVPYIVGERGPELFVPRSNGQIIANRHLGGGPTYIVNFHLPGGLIVHEADLARTLQGVMIKATRRGFSFSGSPA